MLQLPRGGCWCEFILDCVMCGPLCKTKTNWHCKKWGVCGNLKRRATRTYFYWITVPLKSNDWPKLPLRVLIKLYRTESNLEKQQSSLTDLYVLASVSSFRGSNFGPWKDHWKPSYNGQTHIDQDLNNSQFQKAFFLPNTLALLVWAFQTQWNSPKSVNQMCKPENKYYLNPSLTRI